MEDWRYADLRALDAVDSSAPGQDIIALYTRIAGEYFQLRIDFLDLDMTHGQDVYVLIDTHPGGSTQVKMAEGHAIQVAIDWEYLVHIPPVGNIQVMEDTYSPLPGTGLLVTRDTAQDNVVISFRLKSIPLLSGLSQIQVLLTAPGQTVVTDMIDPVRIDAPSPARARIAIAFWNTFTSTSPAETLRSWKGAHSGPMSTRHGLYYLLDAAARTKTPVALLDLSKPDNLSAMDYLNVLPWLQELNNQGILVFPTYESSATLLSDKNKNDGIGVITNRIVLFMMNKFNYFDGGNDYAKFIKTSNCFSIRSDSVISPFFAQIVEQCKLILLNQAISTSPSPLILGGDFLKSLLGDPAVSLAFFNYVDNHPWIQVLNRDDLLAELELRTSRPYRYLEANSLPPAAPSSTSISPDQKLPVLYKSIYSELNQLPKNQISNLAWQVFYAMVDPHSPASITLRDSYIGQIGQIIEAAKWVERPYEISRCDTDLDYDNKNECILANHTIFLTIEPEGGIIPFIFSRDIHGAHQIIGPTWEFMLGMSDPTLWDLSQGIRSDPGQILGAFDKNNNDNFSFVIEDHKLYFYSDEMTMRISVKIMENGVLVSVFNQALVNEIIHIPLVVDPWTRFTPDWGDKYTFAMLPDGINWGISAGVNVDLQSSEPIAFFPFNATHADMLNAEDPNFDYPPGHYLPYPMAVAEINPSGNYVVKITIHP
jgi:hypothetical protein